LPLQPRRCFAGRVDKPCLVLVSDDARVLDRLAADVGRRFSGDCTIVAERSAHRALERLEEFRNRNTRVAILVTDEHLGEMTGLEFLARAHRFHPQAKRVLMVEYDYRHSLPVVGAVTPGIFAAGDMRHRLVKRVASAFGEGAMAVQLVHEYLAEPEAVGR
jgi:CheY-like chemotaxis protein